LCATRFGSTGVEKRCRRLGCNEQVAVERREQNAGKICVLRKRPIGEIPGGGYFRDMVRESYTG
jgi:aspartokinase-like uncharacterized kinase